MDNGIVITYYELLTKILLRSLHFFDRIVIIAFSNLVRSNEYGH